MFHQAILQNVINQLKAHDALALKEAFPGDLSVNKCYQSRIDPVAYLSKTFMHPVTLMSAMFDSGCVISGSRALEFFIPGSITPQSDWDFYVPGYKESVADMINVLALCGVAWDLEGDAIVTVLTQSGTVEVAVRTMEALSSWMSQLDAATATTLMGESLYQVLSAFLRSTRSSCDKSYTISIDPDNQVVVMPNHLPEYDDEGLRLSQQSKTGTKTSEWNRASILVTAVSQNSPAMLMPRLPAIAVGNGRLLVTADSQGEVLSACWPCIDSPNQFTAFYVRPISTNGTTNGTSNHVPERPLPKYLEGTNIASTQSRERLAFTERAIERSSYSRK
ncbi:hypothetical protein EDB81DRAFT_947157 [Dactylonectria macrodidyma]|uniref:Uncharacterized protein n=1 Tax=Dactylonectria macrodidyma TaxID=307937 RepID=A0A9P9J8B6_9HYPO|nr:hypothetical protein EDB81DRAFT_947157 [Dactylonectria macrodidyma]